MKKKKTCLIILLFVMTLILAGCNSTSNKKEYQNIGTEKETKLTYCTWEDEEIYTEKIVDAFVAEHPYIQVEVEYISNSLTNDEIIKLLDEKEIDLINLKNINDVITLKNAGKVLNITVDIEESDINVSYYGNMYNAISIEGDYYCLPNRKTSWVLIYNKDIFDREGIFYREQMTWEEYADLAKELTKGEGNNKQWGGYMVDWVYNFMGIQEKNYLYDDDLTYVQKSLEFLNQIYNQDMSHKTQKEMLNESWLEVFEEGKIAMMPQGEWFVGMIMADEAKGISDVNWDLAPMPIGEGQKPGTTWGLHQVAAITANSNNKTEAFEFLEYLCGEQGAKLYASNGMIPAYIDEEIQTIYRNAIGKHNADVFFNAYQISEKPTYEKYTELERIYKDEADEYLKGAQTIEETMNNFIQKRKAYYEKR